jgi:hypothetical protein
MTNSSDEATFSVHDGTVWMHFGDERIIIPSHLLKKSQFLDDAVSSTDPSVTREFTLPAPKEWLQAWMTCFGGEEELLQYADVDDLVNCLLVRIFS